MVFKHFGFQLELSQKWCEVVVQLCFELVQQWCVQVNDEVIVQKVWVKQCDVQNESQLHPELV